MVKTKLIKYGLYEEDGRLFMNLVYENEDEHRVAQTEILKVDTCIYTNHEPCVSSSLDVDECFMECGGLAYPLCKVNVGSIYGKTRMIHRVVREKTTEMTLEEIEKKLGYKIKIISKNDNT